VTAPTLPPVLPVGDLVRRSYGALLDNSDGLVRIGLVWLLVPLAIQVAATALGEGGLLLSLIADLISLVGLSAIAVAWHRHVLLGEPLRGPIAPVNGRVLKYLLFGLVVAIVAAIPGLVILTASSLISGSPGGALSTFALLAGAIAAVLVFARLQLVFPGTAVGDPVAGLGGSWRLTQGNGVRLFVGILLSIVPVLAAVLVAQLIAGMFQAAGAEKLGAFLGLVAATAGGWVQAPLVAGFLSYAYLFFREVAPPSIMADQG
jgi:hypothetical protein